MSRYLCAAIYLYVRIGVLLILWGPAIALGQTERIRPGGSKTPEAVRLDDLIRLALERSPEVAASRRAVDVAHSRVGIQGMGHGETVWAISSQVAPSQPYSSCYSASCQGTCLVLSRPVRPGVPTKVPTLSRANSLPLVNKPAGEDSSGARVNLPRPILPIPRISRRHPDDGRERRIS